MRRADEHADDSAERVDRLLEHDDPDSEDYALARFAAEKVVADLPDAMFEEHEVFMDAKLDEARLVEDAIDRLAVLDSAVGGTAEAAMNALRHGRFEDVDAVLGESEESREDPEVRVCVRSARAEAALVRGDATAAADHYVAAASYLAVEENDPESREEAMLFRSRAVGRLIRHADTFGGDGGWIEPAMELCYTNIRNRDTHEWNRGARQMDAGSAQLSSGRLKDASTALDLFLGAEYAFRIASQHFGRDRFPGDWAAAQNGCGLAQAHFCFRFREGTGRAPPEGSWTGSEDSYRSAMEVQWETGRSVQWAKTRINLGYLLVHRGRAEGGEAGQEFLRQAVEECRGAQSALTPEIDPDDAMNHLLQAMVELTTAQDFLWEEDLPLREASVERLMARLQRQTERVGEA